MDVSNITMMFKNSQFNKNISNWDVLNVTDMRYLFDGSQFNKDK